MRFLFELEAACAFIEYFLKAMPIKRTCARTLKRSRHNEMQKIIVLILRMCDMLYFKFVTDNLEIKIENVKK